MLIIIKIYSTIIESYMFIIRLLKNYYKNFNIIRVYTFLKHAILPIFYMYTVYK